MVGKLLGECKRRGEEIRAWRDISKGRVVGGVKGRKTLKKEKLNRQTAFGAGVLFDANTGIKREGLRR